MKKGNFTKILALALTVLMVVGVIPFTVFAEESSTTEPEKVTGAFDATLAPSTHYVAPTGDELKANASVGASNLSVYHNYDSNPSWYRSSGLTVSNGVMKLASTTKALNGDKDSYINVGFFVGGSKENTPNASLQGKDFVFSADFKRDGTISAGQFLVFNSFRKNESGSNAVYTAIPLWIDAKGNIYVTNDEWTTEDAATAGKTLTYAGGTVWAQNGWSWNGNLTDKTAGIIDKEVGIIATLSEAEFVNIAVQVTGNKWMVYVNGEKAFDTEKTLMSETVATEYYNDNGVYTDNAGFATTHVTFGYRKNVICSYLVDNTTFYYGDTFVKGTTVTDSYYVSPTLAELKEGAGESNVLYYNDFESLTTETVVNISNLHSSAFRATAAGYENVAGYKAIIADANGNKAVSFNNIFPEGITTGGTGGAYFITPSNRQVYPDNQGKNFVVSADFRLDGAITAGQFLVLNSWRKNTSGSNAPYTAIPLWIDAKGNIYVTNDEWTTEDAATAGKTLTYAGGTVWAQNGWSWNGNLADKTAGIIDKEIGVIATLTKDDYVNIAVQVKNNQWMVYVNGEQAFDTWKVFMSESAATAYYNDVANGYEANGGANGTGGFAFTSLTFHYRNYNANALDNFVHDNIAIYWGDTFVNGTVVVPDSVFDAAKQTGYKYDLTNEAVRYYENGVLQTSKLSADGLLTIDANGKVLFNGAVVTSMDEIYTTDENGDIIMVNGLYPGYYRANALLGKTDGTLYYYNGDHLGNDASGINNKRFDLFQKTYYMDGQLCTKLSDILDNVPSGYRVKVCEDLDYAEESVITSNEVKLELQQYTLTAAAVNLTNDKTTVSSTEKEGVVGGIASDNVVFAPTDGTIMAKSNDKYVSVKATDQQQLDGTSAIFRPTLGSLEKNQSILGAGAGAADLKLVVEVWEGDTQLENTQGGNEWVYSDEMFNEVYANGKAFKFTINNLGERTVTVKYYLVSGTDAKVLVGSAVIGTAVAE